MAASTGNVGNDVAIPVSQTQQTFIVKVQNAAIGKCETVLGADRAGDIVEEYDLAERSSTMNGKNFYDFVEQVRQFLAEFYGVVTEDPDPEFWRKKAA